MKVSILQTDIQWSDTAHNILKADEMIAKAPKSDLYVLPEMWNTGFIMNPEAHAAEAEKALDWMKETARKYDAAVAGSMAMRTEGGFVNRLCFVLPDGSCIGYDKHHLFRYGGEDLHYEAGNQRVVVRWRGTRFLLLVCYDIRFPLWDRYQGDYDAMIVVANWPVVRRTSWNVLTRARAIENQCTVIACNRVGDDPSCHYIGESMIIDWRGEIIAQADGDGEQTVSGTFDNDEVVRQKNKFDVLSDRDNILPNTYEERY